MGIGTMPRKDRKGYEGAEGRRTKRGLSGPVRDIRDRRVTLRKLPKGLSTSFMTWLQRGVSLLSRWSSKSSMSPPIDFRFLNTSHKKVWPTSVSQTFDI